VTVARHVLVLGAYSTLLSFATKQRIARGSKALLLQNNLIVSRNYAGLFEANFKTTMCTKHL